LSPKRYGVRATLSCIAAFCVACADSTGIANAHFELAFARSERGSVASDVYVARADGSHATRLTTNAFASTPRWSPDGNRIAFSTFTPSTFTTQSNFLELINADGTDRHVLADGAAPAWSPDGTQIGFTGEIRILFPFGGGKSTPVPQLFTVKADGSDGTTRLSADTTSYAMGSWSPDGNRIVFGKSSLQTLTDEAVFVMAADGTSQIRLTDPAARNGDPTWSPLGNKIAFVSWRDGNSEIYTMNPDGSGQARLTTSAADDMCPAWSPDGSRIAFTSNRDGFFQIYFMNADGSSPVRLKTDFADTCPSWKAP
jgi:Tol biopolymer transport system component